LENKALLGIQKEDGTYTIVGESSIYYLTPTGTESEISQKDFLKLLHQNAWALGKKGDFEFLKVNEQDLVWLKDASTMNAMWNTILLLHDNQDEAYDKSVQLVMVMGIVAATATHTFSPPAISSQKSSSQHFQEPANQN